MRLRNYRPQDCREIMQLFRNTVHTVNAGDYSPEQLDAWAPENMDAAQWNHSLMEHFTVVAVDDDGKIIGFGDIDAAVYLDRLFVHAMHQGQGIASAICDQLEKSAAGTVTTHASVTARLFFEGRGYRVIRQQTVWRNGLSLTNFVMKKG